MEVGGLRKATTGPHQAAAATAGGNCTVARDDDVACGQTIVPVRLAGDVSQRSRAAVIGQCGEGAQSVKEDDTRRHLESKPLHDATP